MADMEVHEEIIASRNLPDAVPDANDGVKRLGRFGEVPGLVPLNDEQTSADEGSLFLFNNPTPGTGVAENVVSTAFSNTRAFFAIKNTESVNNPKARRIYLNHMRLILGGTAPTATTVMHFLGMRSLISREPTTAANKTEILGVPIGSGNGRKSIARFLSFNAAGAMTVPAPDNADPQVCRFNLPTSLGILGDEYLVKFGSNEVAPQPGLTAVRATAAARIVAVAAPVIIEPGEWFVLHRWWLTEATNPPTFEFEFGLRER